MAKPTHAALRKVTLNAARSKEFPDGSIRHGYDFIAPLDRRRPHRPRILETASRRMFCPPLLGRRAGDARPPHSSRGGPRRLDLGVRMEGGNQGSEEEEGFRFGDHAFKVGEYVSVREEDGELQTFRVVSVGSP